MDLIALKPIIEMAPLAAGEKLSLICGEAVGMEPIDWLWNGWIAKGKLHILAGAAGTGKTTIAMNLAAAITNGGYFPDQSQAPIGDAVIWSGEDDPGDTLAPRLSAAGANMKRIHFVGSVSAIDGNRPFDPAHDIPLLVTTLESLRPALLIVDPIVSAVSTDSNKNAETRRALQPLVDLATRLGTAILGISHFSKGTQGRNPTERVTGSLAFGALARVVMAAAKLEGETEKGRIFCRSKSNIGPDDGGFRYDLEQKAVPGRPDIVASYVVWGDVVAGAARELLAEAETPNGAGGEREAAKDFLATELEEGPVAVNSLKTMAEQAGLSWRTVKRAKHDLCILAEKTGMDKGWQWRLPAKGAISCEECHVDKVEPFGKVGTLRVENLAALGSDP